MNKNLVVGTLASVCVAGSFIGCSHHAKQADPNPPAAQNPGPGGGNGAGGGKQPAQAVDADQLYSDFKDMMNALLLALDAEFTSATATLNAYRQLEQMPEPAKGQGKKAGKDPKRDEAKKHAEQLRDEFVKAAHKARSKVEKFLSVDLNQLPAAVQSASKTARLAVEKRQASFDQAAKLFSGKDPGKALDQVQALLNGGH